nr:MAG TPA: hypothetical protein [Caudoviricetes sp.]
MPAIYQFLVYVFHVHKRLWLDCLHGLFWQA